MIYKVTSAEYKWVATEKQKSTDNLHFLVVLASTFYHFNWRVGSPTFNGSFQFILFSLLSTIFILLLDIISNEKIFIDMPNILFLLFSSLSLRPWRVPVQSMLSFSCRYFSPTNSIDAHLFFARCYVCCRSFSLNRWLFIFCCLQLKEKKRHSFISDRSRSHRKEIRSAAMSTCSKSFVFNDPKFLFASSTRQVSMEQHWWTMFAKETWQTNAESIWTIALFAMCST